MASFAEISPSNVVLRVLEVDDINAINGQEFLAVDCGLGGTWIQTFLDSSQRKNYAAPGYLYDSIRDAFIPPKPYPSWNLNNDTCRWEPPIPLPEDNHVLSLYEWDEINKQWVDAYLPNINIVNDQNLNNPLETIQ